MTHSVAERTAHGRVALRPLPRVEAVGRGLRSALGALLPGVLATVVVWRLGFVVFLVTLAMTVGAAALYARGAGAPARRGLVPLVLLVLGGVVVSFLAVVVSDAWDASRLVAGSDAVSRASLASQAALDPVVLGSYARDVTTSVASVAVGLLGALGRPARWSGGA